MQITEILSAEKGRKKIILEDGRSFILYFKEIRQLGLREGEELPEETYDHIVRDIIGLRAKRRAMHLLERMDRTEHQLREKLRQNYPEAAVELAVDYVKGYHYIDDYRYACSYIQFRQGKKSRQKIKMELMQKGVDKEVLEQAFEQAYEADEVTLIRQWIEKKRFDCEGADRKEFQKMYQFLLRKGFKSSEILHVMKQKEDFYS